MSNSANNIVLMGNTSPMSNVDSTLPQQSNDSVVHYALEIGRHSLIHDKAEHTAIQRRFAGKDCSALDGVRSDAYNAIFGLEEAIANKQATTIDGALVQLAVLSDVITGMCDDGSVPDKHLRMSRRLIYSINDALLAHSKMSSKEFNQAREILLPQGLSPWRLQEFDEQPTHTQ